MLSLRSESNKDNEDENWQQRQAYATVEDSIWVWELRALIAAGTAEDYQLLRQSPPQLTAKWYFKHLIL